MAMKLWCAISVAVFLQLLTSTWVFADDAGLNSTSVDSFNESTSSGGPSNESSFNQEPVFQFGADAGAGGMEGIMNGMNGMNGMDGMSGMNGMNGMMGAPADQPQQQEAGTPTRPPTDPNRVSTFPPLVHNDGGEKSKADAGTTAKPAEKSDKGENGSGYVYGSSVVMLSGVCALYLLN